MQSRTISVLVAGVGAITLLVVTYFAAQPASAQPSVTLLYSREPQGRLLWANQTHTLNQSARDDNRLPEKATIRIHYTLLQLSVYADGIVSECVVKNSSDSPIKLHLPTEFRIPRGFRFTDEDGLSWVIPELEGLYSWAWNNEGDYLVLEPKHSIRLEIVDSRERPSLRRTKPVGKEGEGRRPAQLDYVAEVSYSARVETAPSVWRMTPARVSGQGTASVRWLQKELPREMKTRVIR